MLAPLLAAGKELGESVNAVAEAIAGGNTGGAGTTMSATARSSSPGTPLFTVESSSKRVEDVTSAMAVFVPPVATVALMSSVTLAATAIVGTDQTPLPGS